MIIRTFIALEIPDEVLTKILDLKDFTLGGLPNVKWEPKDKLHLTIKFLGDTSSDLVEEYSEVIKKIILKYKSFELCFNKFGVFKKDNIPKILWAGFHENNSLLEFVQEINSAFSEFGFEKETRKFRSHLTLLRFRGHEDSKKILSLLNVNFPKLNFRSDTVTFYQSKLLQSGSVYKSLKSFYLSN